MRAWKALQFEARLKSTSIWSAPKKPTLQFVFVHFNSVHKAMCAWKICEILLYHGEGWDDKPILRLSSVPQDERMYAFYLDTIQGAWMLHSNMGLVCLIGTWWRVSYMAGFLVWLGYAMTRTPNKQQHRHKSRTCTGIKLWLAETMQTQATWTTKCTVYCYLWGSSPITKLPYKEAPL